MKKDKEISDFMEGLEMTVLTNEEQILLDCGGWGNISGNNIGDCRTTNNCSGGNCVVKCGA